MFEIVVIIMSLYLLCTVMFLLTPF